MIDANVDTAITLVAAATALIAGLMTILMGVIGKYPMGIAAATVLSVIIEAVAHLGPKVARRTRPAGCSTCPR